PPCAMPVSMAATRCRWKPKATSWHWNGDDLCLLRASGHLRGPSGRPRTSRRLTVKSGPGGSLLRLGVLASGAGTNLQALIDASASGALAAEVSIVISNPPDAGAVERAARHGIPSVVVPRPADPSRAERHRRIEAALDAARVGLVVLAGLDEVPSEALVGHFAAL